MPPARKPFTCSTEGDELHLGGTIDEHANLVGLVESARDGQLVLDLGEIAYINSLGVREWIRMQQAAAAAGVRIELRRVAEPLVHQLNIVFAARGVSIVKSFYAPYECDDCECDELVLIDVTVHGQRLAQRLPPPMPCPRCKRLMMFSSDPDMYLAFVAS